MGIRVASKRVLIYLVFFVPFLVAILYYVEQSYNYQSINLFFASSDYSSLESETRLIIKEKPINEKLKNTINLLIYGSTDYKLLPIIPINTKLRSLFFFKGELHLNFSKEFVSASNKIQNKRLIVEAVLATIFTSFPKVEKMFLYVEYKELKTIDGVNIFAYPYRRGDFLKTFSSTSDKLFYKP